MFTKRKELDETDIKSIINKFVIAKKSGIATFGCINCEHLFALIHFSAKNIVISPGFLLWKLGEIVVFFVMCTVTT